MTRSIASWLVPAAIAASLLAAAPAAHAEADGATHAWLNAGTPLRPSTTVWVRQENTEDPVAITVKATIKVGAKTIATLPAVTAPPVSEFVTSPLTLKIPAATIAAAKRAATKAKVTDAQVTFRTSATFAELDNATVSNKETIAMSVLPGIKVGRETISGITFTTGSWQRVARSKWGVTKYAPVAAGAHCSTVISARVALIKTSGQHPITIAKLRGRLANAKLVQSGTRPVPYVIGTLKGGVPRLVNGIADAPPIVRAIAAVDGGHRRTKVLTLEARPDASCKPATAGTAQTLLALQQAITTAHPAS